MTDLFEHAAAQAASYPQVAGFKDRDTSKKAAQSVDANKLRGQCLKALTALGKATADIVADYLDLPIWSIRPRFSELLKLDKIEDTGDRWPNQSGRKAKVWRLK